MKKLIVIAFAISCAASAYADTTKAEIKELKTYCQPDVERLCPGVDYGNGAVKACLKKHEMEISVGCAKALKALKDS